VDLFDTHKAGVSGDLEQPVISAASRLIPLDRLHPFLDALRTHSTGLKKKKANHQLYTVGGIHSFIVLLPYRAKLPNKQRLHPHYADTCSNGDQTLPEH
jgi:hypothetical protein